MKKITYRLISVLIAIILTFSTRLYIVHADSVSGIYYVSQSNGLDSNPGTQSQPFQTIQAAIDRASSGDTILVSPGTYTERPRVRYKDNLSVICQIQGTCIVRGFDMWGNGGILDGFVSDSAILSGLEVRHTNNTIKNIEIKNVQITSDNDGVRVFGSGHIFSNLYIHDYPWSDSITPHQDCFQTWEDSYRGGVARDVQIDHVTCINLNNGGNIRAKFLNAEQHAANWHVKYSVFVGPYITVLTTVDNFLIERNTFIGTGHDVTMGIRLHDNSTAVIRNNIFVNFTWNAISAESGSVATASNNCYWNNRPRTPDPGDVYADPLLNEDYTLAVNSPCGNMGAFANTYAIALSPQASYDGWILEASETNDKGGTKNNRGTVIYIGDNTANEQYRSILSFDTADIPANAVITKVTLRVKRSGVIGGGNPIKALRGFMVDIKQGTFGTAKLALGDFQAKPNVTYGPYKPVLSGGWYNLDLSDGESYLNRSGNTQIRLRFKLDDNNNSVANYLELYSGNAGAVVSPQLVVEYMIP